MRRGLALIALVTAACTAAPARPPVDAVPPATTTRSTTSTSASPSPATTSSAPETAPAPVTTEAIAADPEPAFARPDWLGTRVLPLRDDGFGEVLPTPPELVDRRLATIDYLPPPASAGFESSVGPVPPDVVARSTWNEECPVTLDELRYVTVSHVGFDGALHTGELIVNAAAADAVVDVFHALFDARFPLEQVRVIPAWELDIPPTGDGNDTSAFVCRPTVGSTNWSQHAYGLAIDINPFHNPYVKADLVLPELASAYVDRTTRRPGMISDGDTVVAAFAEAGWEWGGHWNSLADWMHFSANGR